jgi:hypothetical protein
VELYLTTKQIVHYIKNTTIVIQGVSGGIVNILGGGSMGYSR